MSLPLCRNPHQVVVEVQEVAVLVLAQAVHVPALVQVAVVSQILRPMTIIFFT